MFFWINLLEKNGILLSFGKPVLSSDILSDNPRWAASNAVKRSNESDILEQCTWNNAGSVAIAGGIDKFWQVDLQEPFFITKVQALGFNRPSNDEDGSVHFFHDVQINVCQDAQGKDCRQCNDALLAVGEREWGVMLCSANTKGRYIRLVNSNTGDHRENWHFCRVEIYGFDGKLYRKITGYSQINTKNEFFKIDKCYNRFLSFRVMRRTPTKLGPTRNVP